MSTSILRAPAAASGNGRMRRHRLWMRLGAAAGIVVTVALAANGLRYYVLNSAERASSPLHEQLRPSGSIGDALGIAGAMILALVYLYPLRKRWKWLAKKGKTKNWLDYHILMGLFGPVLITFHSSFKLRGVAGLAWWSMIAVVASGIVGRYLYNRIPRRLGSIEMSLEEAEQSCASLAEQIHRQKLIPEEELRPLLDLPSREDVQGMPLARAFLAIVRFDLRRMRFLWRLKRHHTATVREHDDLLAVLSLVRRHAALSKDALFLDHMRRVFHLWHIVHRPFSYALLLMATLHVGVVLLFGF